MFKSASHVCKFCKQPATEKVLWADGRAYMQTCKSHLSNAKSKIGKMKMDNRVTAITKLSFSLPNGVKNVLKHPSTHLGVGLAAASGTEAAIKNHFTRKNGSKAQKKELKEHPIKNHPLTRAAISGAAGVYIGKGIHDFEHAFKYGVPGSIRDRPGPVPKWLKGVKTKEQAKSAWRQQARATHPDIGGDPEKFKQVAKEWEGFEKHRLHKLSHVLPAFIDELSKIAGIKPTPSNSSGASKSRPTHNMFSPLFESKGPQERVAI